jgi:hypothetical protein
MAGKNMKPWLCAAGLALSLGCATAVVRPYVGDQQAWPTASGGIVNTKYALPVFTSLPPSSYDVLAELRISSLFYAQPEEGHMPQIVKKAKSIGADAVMFVQGKIFFSTNYGARSGTGQDTGDEKQPTLTTVNTFNPESFAPEVTILAIRWTGTPPPGLTSQQAASATNVVAESTPTPLSLQWRYTPGDTNVPAEPTPPPAVTAPDRKVAPTRAEESNTNAVPIPPITNFEPGNSFGQ